MGGSVSLKIVNNYFCANSLKHFFHEFNVHGMNLVIILRFFIREYQIQGDLIRLIDDGSMARSHFTDVKMRRIGNGL